MTSTTPTDPLSHWIFWTGIALAAACFAGFQLARIYYRRGSGQSPLSRVTHDTAHDLEDIAHDLETAIDRWQTGTVGTQTDDDCSASLSGGSGVINGPDATAAEPVDCDTWDGLVAHIRAARSDIRLRRQVLQQVLASAHPLTSSIRGKAEMTARLKSLLSLQLRYDQPFSLALLRLSGATKSDPSAAVDAAFEPHAQRLGTTIIEQVRETDLVARYDHNTFAVVMPQTRPDAACQLIERIRDVMETVTNTSSTGTASSGTASSGAASSGAVDSPWHVFGGVATADYQDDVQSLLARAEEAADQAQSHGVSRIHHHDGNTTLMVPAGFTMAV